MFNRLKWREVVNFHVLYGKARQENFDIIAPESTRFTAFDKGLPYMEVGYGIENIFKFVRVEAFHRITYRDRGKNNFGIKATLQLSL